MARLGNCVQQQMWSSNRKYSSATSKNRIKGHYNRQIHMLHNYLICNDLVGSGKEEKCKWKKLTCHIKVLIRNPTVPFVVIAKRVQFTRSKNSKVWKQSFTYIIIMWTRLWEKCNSAWRFFLCLRAEQLVLCTCPPKVIRTTSSVKYI